MLPIVYHPCYSITWPDDHRFPMSKFAMLHQYLLEENIIQPEWIHVPRLASRQTLELVHDPEYLEAFCSGNLDPKASRRIGMPWYPELVTRTHAEVGGTILTTQLALKHGLACNLAGGTHHAYPDFGSGFCILNDIAVAARLALRQQKVQRILILDLDVHQGDGNAFVFRDDPQVFTLSIHGAKNFPFRKQQSDLDIGLPNGTDDAAYLKVLRETLDGVLFRFCPDLVIYDAGVDVHKNDRLGHLNLSDSGLLRRDLMVIQRCQAEEIPIATVIGGGYSEDRNKLAPRHAQVIRAARSLCDE